MRHLSAPRIHDELQLLRDEAAKKEDAAAKKAGKSRGLILDPVPSAKTIQRILRDMTPDESGPWQWDDAENDPRDVALVLPVVKWLIEQEAKSATRRLPPYHLSKKEARLIARLRRIDDTMSPAVALETASHYLALQHFGYPREVVEQITWALAFRPWRSQDDLNRYLRVVIDYLGGPAPDWEFFLPIHAIDDGDAGPISMPDFYMEELRMAEEAIAAEITAVAHDAARDAGFTDEEGGKEEEDD